MVDEVSDTPTDETVAEEDIQGAEYDGLAAIVKERFDLAKRARYAYEQRWNAAYYNYRGLYGREIKFTSTEKSRVFLKLTKTKVLAAYGQLIEVLFAAGKFPITIEPTTLPEGIVENAHVDVQKPTEVDPNSEEVLGAVGFPGDGEDLQPGETISQRIGSKLARLYEKAAFKVGIGKQPTDLNVEPAKIAAKKMQKKIHDQLEESDASTHMRHAALEAAMLGTGVIKGPMAYDKEYPKWDDAGAYTPVKKTIPIIEAVSVWDYYPDPNAITCKDVDWVVQRHRMTVAEIRNLKKRPHFMDERIEEALNFNFNWTREWWETELDDKHVQEPINRFEVLEYWGNVEVDHLSEYPIYNDMSDAMKESKQVQVNVWQVGHVIIRVVINPYTPRRIPYFVVPYEINPYNQFGVGVAENMEDSQTLVNGFVRMAVDNAALSGNILLELDETMLAPGQDLNVHPGKIFRRQSGQPGASIHAIKWPNTTQENMLMYEYFRRFSDEQTGIPSFSHGSTGVMSTGRTAAGMSMLMGAAALNIKTVVKNFDDYLLQPLGESLFAFNMQFDFDPDIKGDLEVKARGIASLMQKEVKSQRLLQFMQITANPVLIPKVNVDYVLREIADALDLDPEKAVNNEKEAMLQSQLMQAMTPQTPAGAGAASPGGAPSVNDETGGGGGNIGVGGAPEPGNPQFTGNTNGGTETSGQ